ncbi:MAG: four helix bundle protein [Lewinellaceae bacterium]|nr:four helix bundle protein [Lewinellaceae bacterium]
MEEISTKNDPLREKTIHFAIRVVNLSRYLTDVKKEYTISKQMLRAGTKNSSLIIHHSSLK